MAVVDADYTAVIGYMREHIRSGTRLNQAEMLKSLAVVKDAVARFAVATPLTALTDAVTAKLVILQAKGTADASVEIDTADTVLSALVTAAVAAVPTVPTYTSSAVADGDAVY